MHLAADFTGVIGLDVSEGMLRVARAHISASNVRFRLSNGMEIPEADASADAVFSTHVFQHLESLDLALANFAEVARVLRPEATAMIHLPMYQLPSGLSVLDSIVAARHRLSTIRARVRRRRRKPLMRGLTFSWAWLFRELPNLGFSNIQVIVFATPSNDAIHPCVLVTR